MFLTADILNLGPHCSIYHIDAFCDLAWTMQYQRKAWIKDDKNSNSSMFDDTVESPMGAAILK